MQKVISININASPNPNTLPFQEHDFPKLNELLADGYKVINVYQIAPSPSLFCTTITFVLEK
jgi:hypothetical protein